jgi:hypothetical protein
VIDAALARKALGVHRLAAGSVAAAKARKRVADAHDRPQLQHTGEGLAQLVDGKLQSAQFLLRDQQRQQASAGIYAPAAAEPAKQHVHGIGHIRHCAVLAVLLQPDGKDRQRIPLLPGSQNARADQRGQQRGIVLLRLLGKAVEQQRQQKLAPAALFRLLRQQAGEFPADLPADLRQRLRQLPHADGLEQIADDIILNGFLGIGKVIIAAQEGDLRQRPQLAHLLGQTHAADIGHADVRQQQIRLQLLDELQGIKAVSGAPDEAEADLLPRDHAAHRLAELRLVIRHDHGQQFLLLHGCALLVVFFS